MPHRRWLPSRMLLAVQDEQSIFLLPHCFPHWSSGGIARWTTVVWGVGGGGPGGYPPPPPAVYGHSNTSLATSAFRTDLSDPMHDSQGVGHGLSPVLNVCLCVSPEGETNTGQKGVGRWPVACLFGWIFLFCVFFLWEKSKTKQNVLTAKSIIKQCTHINPPMYTQ